MPDLTAQAATFRGGRYSFTGYIGTLPQTVVFSRAVNMTTITYDIQQITYDDAYTGAGVFGDVKVGMLVRVHDQDTSTIKGYLRVAANGATASVLNVNEFSQGTLDLADNDRFDVLDVYNIHDKLVGATATFPKDSRVEYTDETNNYPPVANGGGAWFGFVDDGASIATIDFNWTDSFPVDPANATGLTYLVDVDDGTITTGTTTTSTNTTTFPVGFRHVQLTVTDADNSATMTKQIPVYVYNDASPPLAVQMETVSGDMLTGWRATFRLPKGNEADIDTLPDGAFICYFERERYSSTEASYGSNAPTDRNHIKFTGYLVRDSIRIDATTDEAVFEAVGPLAILEQTGALPQLMVSTANPDTWQEAKTLTVRRGLWYLIFWHTTALEYFDFEWPAIATALTFSRLAIEDTSSITGQLRDLAQSIGVDVTCDRLGRILLRENPNDLSTSDRASVTTAYNLTTADIISVDWDRDHRRITKFVRGEGITTGSDPVFSNAPGNAPGEGSGTETLSRQIISSQSDLNSRTGRRYAFINNLYNNTPVPRAVRLALPDGYDVFDPALREFVTLTLPDTTNKRGIAFDTTTKFIVSSVNINYDPDTGAKEIEATLQHETDGPAGVTYVPPAESQNGLPPLPDFDFNFAGFGDLSFDISPIDNGLGTSVADLAAFNTDGYVYFTGDFQTPSSSGGPTWTRTDLTSLATPLAGTLDSFAFDAFSPSGTVNGWIVTRTNIYRVTDVFSTGAGIALTSQHTFASTTNLFHRFIDTSFGFENFAAIASTYVTNASVGQSTVTATTDGSTWTEVTVTAAAGTKNPIFPYQGLHISSKINGLLYTVGYVSGVARLYKSANSGATWSQVTPQINFPSSGAGPEGHATVHAPFEDNNGDVRVFLSGWVPGSNSLSQQKIYTAQVGVDSGTDITPVSGIGPCIYQRSLSSLGANSNRIAYLAPESLGINPELYDLYTTTNGGLTVGDWTLANDNIEEYSSLALVGEAQSDVMYLWGRRGAMGYSSDFGVTVDDRKGNMNALGTPGRMVNIVGKN